MIGTVRNTLLSSVSPTATAVGMKRQESADPVDMVSLGGEVPQPSDRDLLQMGLGGYLGWCSNHGRSSELDWDMAAVRYYEVKTKHNDQLAAALPSGGAEQLKTAVKGVQNWVTQRLNLMRVHEGGGTMYRHALPREYATVADVETRCIHMWDYSGSGPLEQPEPFYISGLQPTTGVDVEGWKLQLKDEATALQVAQEAVEKLPDSPRWLMTRYMADTSKTWSPVAG